ncbi:Polyketide biosynthesis 3-hydroxy-3-methylglutaryl-ACP synthase PksG [Marinobacterium sp. xm-d-420]|uniref:hydroxymethylglutaryl-CoA synthase n=1 Tax=Marinobacterium sp. xm-d-420 TaxID=2497737 RepID=UPI001568EE84|nr:hydroxymethylglutaryl-CoA synthase [Marinobacterium sp. xm-d-420]NRP28599.1 Polyketide biosynthesis 3-hydroxy-3-methylglutaryl-ACP synthase PksG [Marinobacterium sp. xm-d-420]
MSVGIDEISFYTSSYYLDLRTLAERQGTDPNKYYDGIGQEKMAMAAHDEDIVTLAANAALPIVERIGTDAISTILFATETGIDQSKAAGVYVHRLLGLNSRCRVVELKHACYSATAAVQMACALVARNPSKQVLVIASDVARYDLDSPGEATQGCGAVAMLIKANPRVLEIEPESGTHTEDVMDFWRPNYRTTALVDGKYSTKIYLTSLKRSWENFCEESAVRYGDIDYFCYHLPFGKMAQKAHSQLARVNKTGQTPEELAAQIEPTLIYNRLIGNCYTASMYIGLCSLLEQLNEDLTDKRIGLFSYGSGSVSEFFTAKVVSGYQSALNTVRHAELLKDRTELSYEEYLTLYRYPDPRDGGQHVIEPDTQGRFRLAAISDHKREYVER